MFLRFCELEIGRPPPNFKLQNQKSVAAAQFQAQKTEGILKDIIDQYTQLVHWDAPILADEHTDDEFFRIDLYGRK